MRRSPTREPTRDPSGPDPPRENGPVVPKETVENSLVLDVLAFAREGSLRLGASGTRRWKHTDGKPSSVAWVMGYDALCLTYTVTAKDGGRTPYSYTVTLTHTPGTYGGQRVWFACPECGHPVRKICLPPAGGRFLCRSCHDLTYKTRQERASKATRARDRLPELLDELDTEQSNRRWLEIYREVGELLGTMRDAPLDGVPPLPKDPPPRRPPGRPRKKEGSGPVPEPEAPGTPEPPRRPRGRPRVKRPYTRRTPLPISPSTSGTEGYCVKCRDRRELVDARPVTLSNGRPAIQGSCPLCQTKVTRMVKVDPTTI